jgi:capsular polysaccharide biosynthesis protein
LVPDRPFINQILNKLDIDPGRVIFQKNGHVYSADIVYYPHFYNHGLPQKMGLIPIGSFGKVREKLSGPFSLPQDMVVYLKREPNSSRTVYNEEELIEKIRKRLKTGLSLTIFEPHNDWNKDKEIMKRARVVIGPHGGAWSNVIFCSENTDVIEFLPLVSLKVRGLNERPCYYGLSSALNLNYWCIEPENFYFDKPGKQMTVNIDELLSVLDQIGVLE